MLSCKTLHCCDLPAGTGRSFSGTEAPTAAHTARGKTVVDAAAWVANDSPEDRTKQARSTVERVETDCRVAGGMAALAVDRSAHSTGSMMDAGGADAYEGDDYLRDSYETDAVVRDPSAGEVAASSLAETFDWEERLLPPLR